MNADSTVELDGWHKTLASVCKGDEEVAEQGENEMTQVLRHRYENVELNDSQERGRDLNKAIGKVPIPTPRNRTPSRDQQTKDVNEEKITEEKEIRAMKRLEDVVALKSTETKTTSSKDAKIENHVSKSCSSACINIYFHLFFYRMVLRISGKCKEIQNQLSHQMLKVKA